MVGERYIPKANEIEFARRVKINTKVGEVEVADVCPKSPESVKPILIVGGWGEPEWSRSASLRTIASEHRRAISIKFPRTFFGSSWEGGAQVHFQKAEALARVLNELNIDKVDVIGQSEGAITATILANNNPEIVEELLLMNPAGSLGPENPFGLAGRFSVMTAKRLFRQGKKGLIKAEDALDSIGHAGRFLFSNIPLTWREIHAISKADIYDMLSNIRENGTHVSIIHGVDDTLFPADRVAREAERQSFSNNSFNFVPGDHTDITSNPDIHVRDAVRALNSQGNSSK